MDFYNNTKEPETQTGHAFYTTTDFSIIKLFQYTIQRENYVLVYSKIK